jgi:hypothetical protein
MSKHGCAFYDRDAVFANYRGCINKTYHLGEQVNLRNKRQTEVR